MILRRPIVLLPGCPYEGASEKVAEASEVDVSSDPGEARKGINLLGPELATPWSAHGQNVLAG